MLKQLINGRNIYGRKLVRIPTSRFAIFYNGKEEHEELMYRCPWLKEYMILVNYVREFHRGKDDDDLENAIERAIVRCIEENV